MRALLFVCFISLLLTNCSANTFKDPVTAFGASVDVVDSAVAQYAAVSSDYALRAETTSLIKSKQSINFNPGACTIGAKKTNCAVEFDDNGKLSFLIPPEQIPARKLSAALKSYSDGLSTIVNATTTDDFATGLDDLSEALKNLGTDAGLSDKSAFLTDIGPITTLVKFVGTNYFEYKRLEILKTSVLRADPTIQRATKRLAALVGEQQRSAIALQATLIATTTKRYNILAEAQPEAAGPARDRAIIEKTAALDSALSDQTRLRDLLKSDVRKAILGMGAAHSELAAALKNPEVSLKDLYGALKKFYSDAKAAFEAIQKIK